MTEFPVSAPVVAVPILADATASDRNFAPVPAPKKFPTILIIILSLVTILAISFAVFALLQIKSMRAQLTAKPSPTASPTASADPTSNWKTYMSSSFSVKLPSDFKQDPRSSGDHMVSDNQQITIAINANWQKSVPGCSTSQSCYQRDLGVAKGAIDSTNGKNTYQVITSNINGNNVDGILMYDPGQSGPATNVSASVTLDYYVENNGNVVYLSFDIPGDINNALQQKVLIDQILSTFKFTNTEGSPTPSPSSSIPAGWKAFPYPQYGITMYAPSNWKSGSEDFPENPSSLIRFWLGATQDTTTISLDIKTSWANTGDAPYQPKNYIVAGNIAAVRVDPPQKADQVLDRYQTNVYFEHGTKTYVFSCVHNWIPEQVAICDNMLKTIKFSE